MPGATLALESSRIGPSRGWRPNAGSPLGQYERSLAEPPNAFAPGAITPGSTFMILPPFSCEPVRSYTPTVRRKHFCATELGSLVWMRKLPSRRARVSNLLAQRALASHSCTKHVIIVVEQEIIPEALRRQVHTVIFILDNGTTHAPKQLEGWLREQERVYEERLHFQVLWLPPNASWLDQIEIWFSLLQRKHLQPNHFLSTDALEASLGEYIAYYNQAAKPINWTYTVEKLEQKLGTHL